jgi:glycosyltransferase involved in cell wall biosynthesis
VSALRRFLALEPYYGGSHRAVLDALTTALAPGGVAAADPGWEADLYTMAARKWKWRMRGSAIVMAQRAREAWDAGARWDVVFASTFVNLAEFKALAGPEIAAVPAIVYFHENQLVYPNRHTAEWDLQFPLTNVVSALAAERCVFTTRWNLERLLEEIPAFLKQFPDHLPRGVVPRIATKSEVLGPPFDPAPIDASLGPRGIAGARRGPRPRIVWPHRWEHDKDPDTFFASVTRLAEEGLDFEVAVAGQAFQDRPEVFEAAAAALGDRLAHLGEPTGRDAYADLLAGSDVAVSTARNEFFGLAMLESCYAGCFPLVPDRLAYPELYPAQFRYDGEEQLTARLRALVTGRPAPGAARHLAEPFTLPALAPAYAELFEQVAEGTRRAPRAARPSAGPASEPEL